MIKDFAEGNIKSGILQLDPTMIVAVVEASSKYGEYIWKWSAVNFETIKKGGYEKAIKEYYGLRADPNANASNTEWQHTGLPGWELIKADIDYYIEKRKHIPGFDLPEDIKKAIKGGFEDWYGSQN